MESSSQEQSGLAPRAIAVAIVAFLVAFGAMLVGAPAFAGTATGVTGSTYTAPYNYHNFNQVYTGTGSGAAVAVNGVPSNPNLPAGYSAARGRLFACGSGTNMRQDGNNVFNSGSDSAVSWTPTKALASGTSSDAWGVVYMWKPAEQSYAAALPFRSPCQSS